MIKLKNISENDVILQDLGMQLLHPNESVELDGSRKNEAANSSQIIQLISTFVIAVIDNDNVQVSDLSLAIDLIKGFSQVLLTTPDKKQWVQATNRPIGAFTCFTSEGDEQDNPLQVGDGTKMLNDHKIGDPLQQDVYVDFNVKENRTFINEGYAFFKSCNFDEIKLSIVPKLTPYISGTNTFFNLYGGFLIVPAAGDGMIQVDLAQIQLVEIPYSIDNPSQRQSAAYWDADYNYQTHTFENLRPNIYAQGQYNIFGSEINLVTAVDISLLGDGEVKLTSNDVAEFGHNMRAKFTFNTNAPDHDWKCSVSLTLHRYQTAETE